MKWIKLLIIILSLSLPIQSYACWDDDMDDDMDLILGDMDDDDGWWNDPWWNDDSWGNEDDYWGGSLPDVDIYPEQKEDPWFNEQDEGYNNEPEEPDDGYTPSVSNNNKGNTGSSSNQIQGNKKSNNYTLKKTDKLSVDIDKLNKLKGFRQGTNNTCVSSGLEFVAKVFGNNQLTEGKVLEGLVTTQGLGALFGIFQNPQLLAEDLARIANDAGLKSTSSVSDIKAAIDNGELVMTTIPVSSGGNHDIIIVGYNNDGYIAYDTDRQQGGVFTIVSEKEVNEIYKVGIKK